MIFRLAVFLVINFGALALGGLFAGNGAASSWYSSLNIAPWTPPGWVFGFAWATIMICFSVYMAILWKKIKNRTLLLYLFGLQWLLNVSWNPAFFYFHNALIGFLIILSLSALMTYFIFFYRKELGVYSLLLLPYVLWLFIASSLNGYVLFMN